MVANRPNSTRILVLGGGVVGASLAWELTRRGRSVHVIDSPRPGASASWAGAGILPAAPVRDLGDPYEQLKSLSHRLHREWAGELHRLTDVDTGFRTCGGLHVALSAAEAATLVANEFWWSEHEIPFERWNAAELAEREPGLVPLLTQTGTQFRGAWSLPTEWQLRNPRQLQALRRAIELGGGTWKVLNEPVRLQTESSGRVVAFRGEEPLEYEQIAVCAGAWSRQLLLDLGYQNGLLPVRGQMILYGPGEMVVQRVVNEGHRYIVPRSDGRILAGSVEEEVGYVNETTEEALAGIRRWAEHILPQLEQRTIEKTWSGLRPGSYDSLPYLGHVAGTENLYVATGHFRSGLYLSCGTAVCVAEVMCGGESPIDLQPFRLTR